MKLLNLFVIFLAIEAKRKKRGRVKGGTKIQKRVQNLCSIYHLWVKRLFFVNLNLAKNS